MYTIKTLNAISPVGLAKLPKNQFDVTVDADAPDGILVRSADLLNTTFNNNLLAIARAGAGVNNIPLERCSEQGIVVFNTPGANANAVKELVLAGLFLASRKVVDGCNWAQTLIGEGDAVAKLVEKGKSAYAGPEIKGKKLGIVGLGGACFPTHVKLMPPPGKNAEVLIVNGVECEPYLTNDHQLMLEHGEEILIGIRIVMKALGVSRAIIGIEANKPDAIEHMRNLASKVLGIEVRALKVKYPQGGEKQLIDACIGRQVPSGALPIETGAVVDNVATLFAIYEAVQKNKPLISRVMTITGKNVKKPGNYLVRFGTPTSQLVEMVGGLPERTGEVIAGGPMMGRSMSNIDTMPANKRMSALLFMPEQECYRPPPSPCIRCAKCVDACPMGLEPYLLSSLAKGEEWEEMEAHRVMDCIDCGSCVFTCPAHRPLLDGIRAGKGKVGAMIRERQAAAKK